MILALSLLPASAFAATPAHYLNVPFTPQVPDGNWSPPWNNACEESSVIMVERYYLGDQRQRIPPAEAKALMRPLFRWEDRVFGGNADTNAERTARLINEYTSFEATIVRNPSPEAIEAELNADRPVITLNYGIALNNPRHRFRRGGSGYHMMVLTGYDHARNQFAVNDPELSEGLDYPYSYDKILSTLGDFDHRTKKVNRELPTVIFTKPKEFIRAAGRRRVYLVREGRKFLITRPKVFTAHRWSWRLVRAVSAEELAALPEGEPIEE